MPGVTKNKQTHKQNKYKTIVMSLLQTENLTRETLPISEVRRIGPEDSTCMEIKIHRMSLYHNFKKNQTEHKQVIRSNKW